MGRPAIGSANYSKGGKKNYFKLKEGDQVFRILPPLFSCAEKGEWSKYYRVEFGYKNDKDELRPFLSPRRVNFQTKMVEVESEAYLRREKLKEQKTKAVEAGNNELKEKINKLLMTYNQDSKHYMNVIDLEGKIGVLKIPHKSKLALDAAIEELRKAGVDPTSVENGRYFVFRRNGTGLDTIHQVFPYKSNVEVMIEGKPEIVQREVVHKLDDSILDRLEGEAFDLSNLFPEVTAEEEAEIVHGGPEAVGRILGYKGSSKDDDSNSASTNQASNAASTNNVAAEQAAENRAEAAPENVASQAQQEAVNNTVSEAAQAVAETAQESVAQTTTTTTAQAETPAAGGASLLDMNEEDFLKQMESGNF